MYTDNPNLQVHARQWCKGLVEEERKKGQFYSTKVRHSQGTILWLCYASWLNFTTPGLKQINSICISVQHCKYCMKCNSSYNTYATFLESLLLPFGEITLTKTLHYRFLYSTCKIAQLLINIDSCKPHQAKNLPYLNAHLTKFPGFRNVIVE